MPFDLRFPTPIYRDTISTKSFNKIQNDFMHVFSDLTEKNEFQKNPKWSGDTHLLSDPTFKKNLIKQYNLETFEQELITHVYNFVDRKFKIKIDASWMTLTRKGESSYTHDHGAADISGVYYFKTNGNDGDLFFESPVKQLQASYVFMDQTRVFYKPAVGTIMLFPGFLEHGVFQNTTNDERVSVSFNLYVER